MVKYCIVLTSGKINPSAPVFKVRVPEDKKNLRAWKSLCKAASKNGWFLKPWNQSAEFHVKQHRRAASRFSSVPCFAFIIYEVDALTLWYAIANDCIESLRHPVERYHILEALRHGSSPFSIVRERSDRDNRLLLTYPRKNLSERSECLLCDVVCPLESRCYYYHACMLSRAFHSCDHDTFKQEFGALLLEKECDDDVEPANV